LKWILSLIILPLVILLVWGAKVDHPIFNSLFRNPDIVEIAKVTRFEKNKWYEFNVSIKAFNRNQDITVAFEGSQPDKLNSITRGGDENYRGSETVFYSSSFPGKEIKFDVLAFDANNDEYMFEADGQSGGIIFGNQGEPLIGKVINKIKIKSNITHKNVQVTWISYAGK